MREYPKINSIFKRDKDTNQFIIGDWSCPEFGLLADVKWNFTEKIDGMNMRVFATFPEEHGPSNFIKVEIGGRTDNAQIPGDLSDRIKKIFNNVTLDGKFDPGQTVEFYGEGYGAGIQKGGGYSLEKGFILFDIRIGQLWLERSNVEDIASSLDLDIVPTKLPGFTLNEAIDAVWRTQKGRGFLHSSWKGATIEGVVGVPAVQLFNRRGERIITKVKLKDFQHLEG